MKIAIMGTGGLGSYIGGCLAHSGQDVTFISRGKQLDALQQDGLRIDTPDGSDDIHLTAVKATDDCDKVGFVDLILICVKSFDVEQAAEQMRPLVGPNTAILPVQNGIDHLDILSRKFGKKHVLGGTTIIGAYIVSPGYARLFTPTTELFFGEIDGEDSARCHGIQKILQVDGIVSEHVPNILERMWWKMVAMSALFGVFSLARVKAGDVRKTPELYDLVLQAVKESIEVAQANRFPLTAELVQTIEGALNTLPDDWHPSMAVALDSGHRLELEEVNGAIRRYGRKVNVPTPIHDVIYACLKPHINGNTAV